MKKILNVYKPIGITPLELIEKVRIAYPELKEEKIGYAGRLDPLAHGVLLLMIGDATKDRDNYLGLEKEYIFEVLFGVTTDTYDILGYVLDSQPNGNKLSIVNKNVNLFVNKYRGKFKQPYPPYSSKSVNGKPLFWWARNNRLEEIEIPTREITVNNFELLSSGKISKQDLRHKVNNIVSSIKGDFRQKESIIIWNHFLTETKINIFQTMRFRIHSSSGTYVRGIADELGKDLGCGAIALEILRTSVGKYMLKDSIVLE